MTSCTYNVSWIFLITATERHIITILAELKSTVQDLTEQVTANTKLLQNIQPNASLEEDYPLPEGVVLPATTAEELQMLEDAVVGDKGLQRHLVGKNVNHDH